MNISEYNKVKDFSYDEYCVYLKNKHGCVEDIYGSANNLGYTRGLFIHHIAENIFPGLSSEKRVEEANEKYPKNNWQEPENLVYCNYLEHALLHIKIAEESGVLWGDEYLVEGLTNYIIPDLYSYFTNGEKRFNNIFYDVISNDKDVFDIILNRYDELNKNRTVVFEDNIVLYKQMKNCLDTSNKALVVLGTNLGKSTTVLQYISSSNLNTTVLVPNIAIKTDWENRQKDYPNIISVMTYVEHSNKHNSIDYNNYGLVVCDEVHHIGADVWGSGVKELLENGNIKVIGITATNERTDGINIEDYFKGCTCFGDSVEDAIEKGILHPISYVTSIYDTTGIKTEIDKYRAKVDPNDETSRALIGRLDIDVNSLNIKKTLTNPEYKMDGKRKGFVFIPDTTSEKKIRPILEDAYPDAVFRSINSNMDKKDIEENKNWFNSEEDSDKDKYLISINMVSEGVHYKGINTLIMFRSTKSHLVYTQQLGRVLTLSKFENPNAIVFDLVNNTDYVDYNYSIKKGRTILSALKSVQKRKKSKQIIISDETRDIVKDLRKLKQITSDDWEDWEIDILKKYYPTEGAEGCQKRIDEEWKNRKTL